MQFESQKVRKTQTPILKTDPTSQEDPESSKNFPTMKFVGFWQKSIHKTFFLLNMKELKVF